MAFLEFERFTENGERFVRNSGQKFSLAGYNLLYKAWERRGRPVDEGWHVSAKELVLIHSEEQHDISSRLLAIDWNPKSKEEIGLIEILDVYGFSWGDDDNDALWTPLMLRGRNLHHQDYEELSDSQKAEILSKLPEPRSDTPDFVEFLYLKGKEDGWIWGRSGMTNAAFLEGEARDYFRRFF